MAIKRLNYFKGEFLHEQDFKDEQQYHIDMLRVHNKNLHTWGIADGLDVAFTAGEKKVTVKAGSAVDGTGRQIVLLQDKNIDLSTAAGTSFYITVAYAEAPSDPRDETGIKGDTRIAEDPDIKTENNIPPPNDKSTRLVLAKVTLNADRTVAALDTGDRNYAGVVAGDLEAKSLAFSLPVARNRWPSVKGTAAGAATGIQFNAQSAEFTGSLSAASLTVSGAVGIGTANPQARLHVAGDLRLSGNLLAGSGEIFFQDNGQVRSLDNSHKLVFNRTNNLLELHEFGDIRFLTGGSTPTEKLRILASGSVGIGTAAPGAFKLAIGGTGGQNALYVASDFALRGNDRLNLIHFGNDGDYQVLHKASGAMGRNTLALHVDANDAFGVYSTGWNPLLEVEGGSGDVYVKGALGIGLINPKGKLDVNGDIYRAGLLAISGEAGGWLRINQNNDFPKGTHFARRANFAAGLTTGNWWDVEPGTGNLLVQGNVGIGTTTPQDRLDVAGAVRFLTGSNPIRITAGWTSFPDAATDRAEISNDTGTYKTLMIVGNKSAGLGRRVSVWDRLEVNGPLITQQAHTVKIGVPSPTGRYAYDGIRGDPNLFLDAAGTVFIKQGFQAIAGFDIAERFKTAGEVRPGDVMVFDTNEKAVRLCDRGYDVKVVGVASGEPAFILGCDKEDVPVALCGRVPCNVDADIAPIRAGDLLTTSPTQGYAQKAVDREKAEGAIIGKALGSMERGKGRIEVLIMMR